MPTMRSRVDCGLGLTMLSFSPTRRLSSVDLPAFGFPTTVTIPAFGMRTGSGGAGWADIREVMTMAGADGVGRGMHKAPGRIGQGLCDEVPATAYSPALSRAEYHRRCRA